MPQPFFPLFISQTSLLPFTTSKKKKEEIKKKKKVYNRKKYRARLLLIVAQCVCVDVENVLAKRKEDENSRDLLRERTLRVWCFSSRCPSRRNKKEDERETCIHNHQHPSIFNGVFHAFYLPFESIIHNNFQFHMRRGSS